MLTGVQEFRKKQMVPAPLTEVWEYFSRPHNLATITPPHLDLRFTNELYGAEAYAGQMITYRVKPLLGIPVHWVTEITHVQKEQFFVDEQRVGPYAIWHHQHHFKAVEGGTEMLDMIHYKLPLGILGELMLPLVRSELKKIFDYRTVKVNERWPVGAGV